MRLPFFARSGRTGRFGKVGPSLGSLRLGPVTEDRVRQEAARSNLALMEWVRELIELRVHGRDVVEREISIRLDLVDGRNTSATESQRD